MKKQICNKSKLFKKNFTFPIRFEISKKNKLQFHKKVYMKDVKSYL